MFIQDFTITITRFGLGMAAVMILLALIAGAIAFFVVAPFVYLGAWSGGPFHTVICYLFIPVIIVAALAGGWFGYWLMS